MWLKSNTAVANTAGVTLGKMQRPDSEKGEGDEPKNQEAVEVKAPDARELHTQLSQYKPRWIFVLHIWEYQRSPAHFHDALTQDPQLAPFIVGLAGGGGAKLIVRPRQRQWVIWHIREYGLVFRSGPCIPPQRLEELKPRHVVFSEEFRTDVSAAVANRRGTGRDGGKGRDNVRPKRTTWLTVAVP